MADTIITNTPTPEKSSGDGSGAGWAVAVIILLAVIIGGFALYQNGFFNQEAPTGDSTNINVTIPNPVTPAPEDTTP
jgi:hypothetical protein